MKAHLPLTKQQSNRAKNVGIQAAESTIYLHDFLWLMALHDTFGFSNTRLQKVCDKYHEYVADFNTNLDIELDVAIARVVNCMNSCGLDYENLLNCKAYQIYDTDEKGH